MKENKWLGRRALVTGGSSGIGRAVAVKLARAGANVIVAARRSERLADTVAEMKRLAPSAHAILDLAVLDVRDAQAVRAAAPEIIGRLGGLDLVVCCAGIVRAGYAVELPDDAFTETIATNYLGAVHTSRAFLEHLIAQRHGDISFVSSFVGVVGIFGYSAYAGSKFALTGYAECLRQELAPSGVRVSVVFPTSTDTDLLEEDKRAQPRETTLLDGDDVPMRASDVAEAYLAGIASGRPEIFPSPSGRTAHRLHRWFPGVSRWIIDSQIRRAQRAPKGVT